MKQPTKEQLQWFWEQCGFKQKDKGWVFPDLRVTEKFPCSLPPIDLNSLFKYAVPTLKDICEDWWDVIVEWAKDITGNYEKDTLALFWAVFKALGGKDD